MRRIARALWRLVPHGPQVLADAVASVTERDLPGGGFAWDRVKDGSIAPLVAATLVRWGLVEHAGVNVLRLLAPPLSCDMTNDDDGFDRHRGLGHEIDIMTAGFQRRRVGLPLSGHE